MTIPIGFVPFGALVVRDCGCAAYRLAGAPHGAVRLHVVRSCPEHHSDDDDRTTTVSPRELVSPYSVSTK